MRYLPSLNGLKAFEAAARHESFTRAAEELCVTQGAVSHKVKALEEELGIKLFKREPRRLSLTSAGRNYLHIIRDAFDNISMGTEQLLQQQNSNALTVCTSVNFAAKWLVHRLGRFTDAHPEIDLTLSATSRSNDFARDNIDLLISTSEGNLTGLHATRLCKEELVPVCSPSLNIKTLSDLKKHPLLHLDYRDDWLQWLDKAGLGDLERPRGTVMNRVSMTIDAAVNGQGVALARTALVANDLIQKRLVRPFDISLNVAFAYWIICPPAIANLPKIVTFRNWLLAEAAEDEKALKDL